MDPFARKMVYGSFMYGGMMLAMFGVLSAVYFHIRPRCTDRVVAEVAAPGQQWTAMIMERRCGEEAAFFTHVNLHSTARPQKYGFFSGRATEGEIFLIEQDSQAAGISVQWSTPDQITIQCSRCASMPTNRREEKWGTVTVHYELR